MGIRKQPAALLLTVFLAVALVMSACSNNGNGEKSNTEGSTGQKGDNNGENGEEQVTITFMSRETGDTPSAQFIKEVIAKFEEANPAIHIQDDSIGDETAYLNKLKSSIASGNPPHIFSYAGALSLLPYAKSGTIMDISPMLEDKEWADGFQPGLFDSFNLEAAGKPGIYSIPWSINYEPIFYNADLFQQAGVTKEPETWDELLDAIAKLKSAGVTPWALGGKDSWRVGHIHTSIFYKLAGVEKAKEIGQRKAKWTDPEVEATFQKLIELREAGAFQENFEGVNYDSEKQLFGSGKAAMTLDGTWRTGDLPKDMNIKSFPFPYFSDKPEYKNNGVNYLAQWVLSGKMEGAEKDAAISFIKFLTNQENQQSLLDNYARLPIIKNVDTSKLDELTKDIIEDGAKVTVPGLDTFSYDPLPAIESASKDALMGMLLGKSPKDMTKQVQDVIDNS
ncbi:extracellular solute-binding protein [Paenibacillus sp. GCM10023252]|uniref:extracellular solute-binding protein n=1 Tax=Paenibacillus sp. GCM10023252 TaxID=3252649 RepID=UPI00362447EF